MAINKQVAKYYVLSNVILTLEKAYDQAYNTPHYMTNQSIYGSIHDAIVKAKEDLRKCISVLKTKYPSEWSEIEKSNQHPI